MESAHQRLRSLSSRRAPVRSGVRSGTVCSATAGGGLRKGREGTEAAALSTSHTPGTRVARLSSLGLGPARDPACAPTTRVTTSSVHAPATHVALAFVHDRSSKSVGESKTKSSADVSAAWQAVSAIVQAESAALELKANGWTPASWASATFHGLV